MARILLLTPQLPYPPQQGTSLRNFHILRALAEHHDVTLLSFADPDSTGDLGVLEALCDVLPPVSASTRSLGQRLRQLLTTREPDMALRLQSDAFQAALDSALRRLSFDAVQVEGLELARYIPSIRTAVSPPAILLDCHNAEAELQRRTFQTDVVRPSRWPAAVYSWLQVGRLSRFETVSLSSADVVIAVSEEDRARLERLVHTRSVDIHVIPNMIDVREYEWDGPTDSATQFDLVFTGKMDYRPNVDGMLWFAEEVWPMIVSARPHTTWAIVGQRPHARLDVLRTLAGVVVTGRVEQIQPYLAGAKVYVLPLRIGSGTRLKLIEAMAAGKAIVSTTTGAEGVGVRNGRELFLADTPTDFAGAVLQLLDDSPRRHELGSAARDYAGQYDWRNMVSRLDAIYAALTKPTGG